MGALKALGSVFKNLAKPLSLLVGPPLALTGFIVFKSSKFLVDMAAIGSAYWIKNNFTGQSTLFGASTALTAFSNSIEELGKWWNKKCFSGIIWSFDLAGTAIAEKMNEFGWGSTGSWNDGNNDLEDIAIHQGTKQFEEHAKAARERTKKKYEENLAKTFHKGETNETEFDRAKVRIQTWLERGKALLEEAREAFGGTDDSADNNKLHNIQETLKKWLKETQTNESLKSILHIIDENALASALGSKSSSLDELAKKFISMFDKIANIEPIDRENFYASREARKAEITEDERKSKNGGVAVTTDKDKARINGEIIAEREAKARKAYTSMDQTAKDALHLDEAIRQQRDNKSLAMIQLMLSKTEHALDKKVAESPRPVIKQPKAKRVGAVTDRTPLIPSGG